MSLAFLELHRRSASAFNLLNHITKGLIQACDAKKLQPSDIAFVFEIISLEANLFFHSPEDRISADLPI